MAKQRFSNRNQRVGMKPPAALKAVWADLGADFQQAVRQQWIPEQPLQVRCAVQEQTLLVLVEHLLHVEPTPEDTFDRLEQTIRQIASDGQAVQIKPEALGVNKLPVQLFLRIAGYQQPYASRQFELDLKPPAKPVIPVTSPSSTAFSTETLAAPSAVDPITPVLEPLPEPAETAVASEVEAPAAETPELAAAVAPELPIPESAAIAEPVLELPLDELPSITETPIVVDPETTETTVPDPEHLPAPVADRPDVSLETWSVLEPPVAELATSEVGQPELEAEPEILSEPEILPESIGFEPLQTEPTEEFEAGAEVESEFEIAQPELELFEENLASEEIAVPVEQPEAIQIAESSPQAEDIEFSLETLPSTAEQFLPESVEAHPASVESVPEFTLPIANPQPAPLTEPASAEFSEPEPGSELLPADWQVELSESALNSDRFLPEDLSEPEDLSKPEPVSEPEPVVEHQLQTEWLEPEAPEAEITSAELLSANPAPATPITTELDPTALEASLANMPIEPDWVASESATVQSVEAIPIETIQEIPEQQAVISTDFDTVEAASGSELSIAEPLSAALSSTALSAELAPAVPSDTEPDLVSPIELFTEPELAPAESSLATELTDPLLTDAWVETPSVEPQASPGFAEPASADADSVIAHVDSPTVSAEIEAESRLQPFNESDQELRINDQHLESETTSDQSVDADLNHLAELDQQPISPDASGDSALNYDMALQAPVTQTWVAPVPAAEPIEPIVDTAKPVASSLASVEVQKPARRFRWSASTLTLAGGIGGFLLASGFYMLSRPCVLGGCEPLQRAEQLGQEAIQTAQTTDSSLAVVEAYGKLNEASYLLGTIPAWSGHHSAAQSLLNRYEDQSVVLGQVVKALEQANTAAQRSQNPPHPLQEWREIQWQWREVISQLEKIPPNHSLYGLVQRKLTEYRTNLTDIDQRVAIEQQAQDRVTAARQLEQAAEDRIKAAKTPANWQETATIWTKAIEQLRQIPQGTMPYDEAQQLLAIYQPKLAEANSKRIQEQSGADAYNQALNAAQQAKAMEQQNQWTQAVTYWQEALSSAQQVPSDTSYYSQIQPLVNTYTQSLQQAQQNAQRAVALQTVKPTLDRACDGSPQPCTYTLSPQAIRVQFTALYDKTVSALITKTPATDSDLPAAIVNQVNDTLRNLAAVGDATQIPIELYNSGGTKLGTYTPEFSGYVPQS